MIEFHHGKFHIKEVMAIDKKEWMCPFCSSKAQVRHAKHIDCGAHLVRVGKEAFAYKGGNGRLADTASHYDIVDIFRDSKEKSKESTS